MRNKLFSLLLALVALVGISQSALAAKSIYIPSGWTRQTDGSYYESSSGLTWSSTRSLESDNVVIFWDSRYGSTAPNKLSSSSDYYVDINDLLTKTEAFYQLECDQLGFWDGESSKYKVMVLLNYTTDWVCYGGGYDYQVPALWLSPSTCKPVGSAVAHEVGHSFHYMCYSEASNHGSSSSVQTGFHSNWSGSNGQAIWETTANWQALQSYPNEFFTESGMYDVFAKSHNYAWSHEWHRYQAYPFLYYLCEKYNDIQTVANVWNHSETSIVDFNQALMDYKGLSANDLYKMYFEYACKTVTWDYSVLKSNSNLSSSITSNIGNFKYNCVKLSDGSYQVAYASCPQSTGFNAIPLTASAGKTVTVDFTALTPGCNLAESAGTAKYLDGETQYTTTTATKYNSNSYASRRGFRIGFVAYRRNGERQYFSEDQVYCTGTGESTAQVSFTVPTNTSKIWMIVTPALTSYVRHSWDESITNDDMWPYKFSLTNATLGSAATVSTAGTSSDGTETLTYTHTLDRVISQGYTGETIDIASEIESGLSWLGCSSVSDATIYFINQSDGSKVANAMGNYDGWTSAAGDAVSWGSSAAVCVKFDPSNMDYIWVCTFPDNDGTAETTYKAVWAMEYNNKQVLFETYVNLVESVPLKWDDFTVLDTEFSCNLSTKSASYDPVNTTGFDASAVATALELTSLEGLNFYTTTDDGTLNLQSNAGARGYWLNSDGHRCEWSDANSTFYVDTDYENIAIGQYPGRCLGGSTYNTTVYFGSGSTLVPVNVTLEVLPDELTDYTVVGTQNYTVSSVVRGNFDTDPIALTDTAAIKTALGISLMSEAKVAARPTATTLTKAYTANRGYFFDNNGLVVKYGDDARFFIETNGAQDTLKVGQFPNACVAGTDYTTTIYLTADESTSLYQINVTYKVLPILLSDYTVVGTYNFALNDTVKLDYAYETLTLEAAAMATKLGVDDLTSATFFAVPTAGQLTKSYTTYDGYYFDENGLTCSHNDDPARFFIETDGLVLRVGQKPNACTNGTTYGATVYFGNETTKKLVQVNLTYNVGVLDANLENLTALIKRALDGDAAVTLDRIQNMVNAILTGKKTE